MAHRMNVGNAGDLAQARFFAHRPTQDHLHRSACISDWFGETLRCVAFGSKPDDPCAADALDQTSCQALVGVLLDALEIGRDQLKLNRRAAAVENEYVHWLTFVPFCGHARE